MGGSEVNNRSHLQAVAGKQGRKHFSEGEIPVETWFEWEKLPGWGIRCVVCDGTIARARGQEVFKLVVCWCVLETWYEKQGYRYAYLLVWESTREEEHRKKWTSRALAGSLCQTAIWSRGGWHVLPPQAALAGYGSSGGCSPVAPGGKPLACKEQSKPGWFACEFPMGNKAPHLANIRPVVKGKLKKRNPSVRADELWTVDSKRASQLFAPGRLEPGMHFRWL